MNLLVLLGLIGLFGLLGLLGFPGIKGNFYFSQKYSQFWIVNYSKVLIGKIKI